MLRSRIVLMIAHVCIWFSTQSKQLKNSNGRILIIHLTALISCLMITISSLKLASYDSKKEELKTSHQNWLKFKVAEFYVESLKKCFNDEKKIFAMK